MKNFNDIVKQLIKEIINEKGVSLYNFIWNKRNVSEFVISEVLEITVNQVRNILYQFSAYNLVSFTRQKDREKGWYIYYWTINFNEVRSLLVQRMNVNLNSLYNELKTEKDNKFYYCERDGSKLELEEAMAFSFKCPECEDILVNLPNTKRIESIGSEIKEIKQDLENISKDDFVKEITSQQTEEGLPKEKSKRRKRKTTKKPTKKKAKKTKKKVAKKKPKVAKKKVAKKKPKKSKKKKK
ncbi:hypothetical protein CL617_04550 [archaeon]|nr:hypothetical protein [archaeon]|tara:strand:- start:11974 stop:12693 length:720 start_codon:yes stop_codon:yes gene_type:complete